MCNKKRDLDEDEDNSFVRTNGWTLPLNGLQVLTWVVILYCGFVFFAIVALSVEPHLYPASYVCIGVFYMALVVSLLVATSINPADDHSLRRNNDAKPRPVFDRSVHKHVIEKGYCHICEVTVGGLSKHCSVCNKCVSVFDHHCKWLNNCVGDKNYRIFLLTLVSAIFVCLGMVVMAIFALVNAFSGFQSIDVWWMSPESLAIAFDVLIVLQCILLLAALILITQLFLFHVMLIKRGMTTFEYIKRTTRLKIDARKRTTQSTNKVTATSTAPTDNNNCSKNDSISFVSLNERSNTQSNLTTKNKESSVTDGSAGASQAFINHGFTSDNANQINNNHSNSNNALSELHSPKEEQLLPNAVPDSSQKSNKAGEHKRRKRKRRKVQIEPLNGAPPRPLPLHPLIESPTLTPTRNTYLPPIRNSVEWTSSVEDLTKGATQRGRLPPLSTRSSSTSLASSALSGM